jgi:ribosomal protein S4
VITVTEKGRAMAPVVDALGLIASTGRKPWIEFDQESGVAKFARIPSRDELDDVDIREQLIVELYSK